MDYIFIVKSQNGLLFHVWQQISIPCFVLHVFSSKTTNKNRSCLFCCVHLRKKTCETFRHPFRDTEETSRTEFASERLQQKNASAFRFRVFSGFWLEFVFLQRPRWTARARSRVTLRWAGPWVPRPPRTPLPRAGWATHRGRVTRAAAAGLGPGAGEQPACCPRASLPAPPAPLRGLRPPPITTTTRPCSPRRPRTCTPARPASTSRTTRCTPSSDTRTSAEVSCNLIHSLCNCNFPVWIEVQCCKQRQEVVVVLEQNRGSGLRLFLARYPRPRTK